MSDQIFRERRGRGWCAVLGYIAAVLLATITGSIVQTQFNLAAIHSLGAEIPMGLWLSTTLQDLIEFSPVLFIIIAVTFLVALPVGALMARILGALRTPLCVVSAAVGLGVAIHVINDLVPMPTLIAATRETPGLIAMLACAGAGGWLYAAMTQPKTGDLEL